MTPVFAVVAKMMMMPPVPVAAVLQLDLHTAYADHAMVQRMTREARFDDTVLAFLVNEAEPLDVRLAVASPMAISDITAAGDAFANAAFKVPLAKVKTTERRGDLLIIAAYLSAMRANGQSPQSRSLADAAMKRAPASFGVAMMAALFRTSANTAKACDPVKALLSPLRDPKLFTDVGDRALFAYSEIVMQTVDMCRASGGHP